MKYSKTVVNFSPFPFAFFSCHPELSRQYFLKLQLSHTVVADSFTEVEHLAGYLFVCQAGCTWLCECCEQMQRWDWGAGRWLFKYHGQGPLHTGPDHPWLHLSGALYVGTSAQPSPFCRHHYLGFFVTWSFWKSCFSVNPCPKALGIPRWVPLYPLSSIGQEAYGHASAPAAPHRV